MVETAARRPAHILVYLSGALGDTLLGFPALNALRSWAPDARITALGRPAFLAPAQHSCLVDTPLDADGPAGAALHGGRAEALPRPDLAIIWSAAYRQFAERLARFGTTSIIAAPPRPTDQRHQARYLLDCLRPLGVPQVLRPAPAPSLPPTAAWAHLLDSSGQPTVLLHPGAGATWKRWPLARMRALARELRGYGYAVRWSAGPADAELRAALRDDAATLWPALGLEDYAALLARCRLLVSPDTGVAHLAAWLGVPQVTLFGPTDPRRWRPLGRRVSVVRAPSACPPWSTPMDAAETRDPLRRCRMPAGDQCSCLAALPAETVLASCLALLGRAGTSPPPPGLLIGR